MQVTVAPSGKAETFVKVPAASEGIRVIDEILARPTKKCLTLGQRLVAKALDRPLPVVHQNATVTEPTILRAVETNDLVKKVVKGRVSSFSDSGIKSTVAGFLCHECKTTAIAVANPKCSEAKHSLLKIKLPATAYRCKECGTLTDSVGYPPDPCAACGGS